jgi:hypothetical protein
LLAAYSQRKEWEQNAKSRHLAFQKEIKSFHREKEASQRDPEAKRHSERQRKERMEAKCSVEAFSFPKGNKVFPPREGGLSKGSGGEEAF